MSKMLIFISLILGALFESLPASAIDLRRGVGTDTWTTWPEPAEWNQSRFIDSYPEWRRLATPKQLAALHDAGFDFVRLTLDPGVFLWKPDAAKHKRLKASLRKTVDALLAAKLNVIVDMHSIPRPVGQPGTESILRNNAAFAKYLAIVSMVGKEIATYDQARVAFEPINEPMIDCPWDGNSRRWPAMAQKLHATARAAAPKLTIVMQGACWGSAEGLADLDPAKFNDRNIIWSFHTYDPMILTHQGASWVDGPPKFVRNLTYPPQATDKKKIIDATVQAINRSNMSTSNKVQLITDAKAELNDYFSTAELKPAMEQPVLQVAAWAKKHKIPNTRILVGEFGVIRGDIGSTIPKTVRAKYLAEVTQRFAAQGWAWSVWNWTGSFGIDTSDNSRIPDKLLIQSLGLGK
jgi:endoglucanase